MRRVVYLLFSLQSSSFILSHLPFFLIKLAAMARHASMAKRGAQFASRRDEKTDCEIATYARRSVSRCIRIPERRWNEAEVVISQSAFFTNCAPLFLCPPSACRKTSDEEDGIGRKDEGGNLKLEIGEMIIGWGEGIFLTEWTELTE